MIGLSCVRLGEACAASFEHCHYLYNNDMMTFMLSMSCWTYVMLFIPVSPVSDVQLEEENVQQ